jgi:hypothetical protein
VEEPQRERASGPTLHQIEASAKVVSGEGWRTQEPTDLRVLRFRCSKIHKRDGLFSLIGDEDKDLGRVGNLERGKPIFLFIETLGHR